MFKEHGVEFTTVQDLGLRDLPKHVGGIDVRWTDNLLDHLLIHDEPPSKTFPLLLPELAEATADWFNKQMKILGLDPGARQCNPRLFEHRAIKNFEYWRDNAEADVRRVTANVRCSVGARST